MIFLCQFLQFLLLLYFIILFLTVSKSHKVLLKHIFILHAGKRLDNWSTFSWQILCCQKASHTSLHLLPFAWRGALVPKALIHVVSPTGPGLCVSTTPGCPACILLAFPASCSKALCCLGPGMAVSLLFPGPVTPVRTAALCLCSHCAPTWSPLPASPGVTSPSLDQCSVQSWVSFHSAFLVLLRSDGDIP